MFHLRNTTALAQLDFNVNPWDSYYTDNQLISMTSHPTGNIDCFI
uniref:Uncharacterized protein n=1 Tax=Anguilla anguilla TaxID=7936 RepID=A0A0E9RXX5_ANGAN